MAQKSAKPRIIFFGSGQFAVPILKMAAQHSEILLVITQPSKPAGRGLVETYCPVDLAAQDLCLDILRPTSLKEEALKETLSDFPCDYLIVAAYGKIIPQWLLNFPKYRPLNLHGSLLPRWRGAAPIQHALIHGDAKTGVQLMQMTLGMDEGPILSEYIHIMKTTDTLESLTQDLGKKGADLLKSFFKDPKIKAVAQSGDPTYAPKITKEMGEILWETDTSEKIIRKLKGLSPWPGLYTWTQENKRVKILDCTQASLDIPLSGQKGKILIQNQRCYAETQDGYIEIKTLQIEGKKAFDAHTELKNPQHWLYETGQLLSQSKQV